MPTPPQSSSARDIETAYFGELAALPRFDRDRESELARAVVRTRRSMWDVLVRADAIDTVVAAILAHAKDATVLACAQELRDAVGAPAAQRDSLLDALDRTGDEHVAADALVRAAAEMDPQWHVAARDARRRFHAARDAFVRANLRLVVMFANRDGRYAPLGDRIQEGNIGLMKAVDRFDPERGIRFCTYAAWWIRHSIRRALLESSHDVKIPVQVQQLLARAERARRRIRQETGVEPDDRRIAQEIDCDPERLEWARRAMQQRQVSVDAGDGEQDLLADETSLEALHAVSTKGDRASAMAALSQLDARVRDIVQHRYDLAGSESLTLTELGRRHGISRERARQLHSDALDQLRRTFVPDAPRVSKRRPSAFLR
jgi:RNA polymerase primary sigma factor